MTFTLVHSSQRFDRPPKLLLAHAVTLREDGIAVTRTEVGGKPYEQIIGRQESPGWSYAQATGNRGPDECAIEWEKSRLRPLASPYAVKLSDLTYVRAAEYGGGVTPPVHALVAPFGFALRPARHLTVITVHMPVPNTTRREEVWIDVARGLVKLGRSLRTDDPAVRLVVAADFNKNHRNATERGHVEDHIAGPLALTQAWDGREPTSGGTHGNALIDGHLVDAGLQVTGARLLEDPSPDDSDHRAFATDLRWVTATAPPPPPDPVPHACPVCGLEHLPPLAEAATLIP